MVKETIYGTSKGWGKWDAKLKTYEIIIIRIKSTIFD